MKAKTCWKRVIQQDDMSTRKMWRRTEVYIREHTFKLAKLNPQPCGSCNKRTTKTEERAREKDIKYEGNRARRWKYKLTGFFLRKLYNQSSEQKYYIYLFSEKLKYSQKN